MLKTRFDRLAVRRRGESKGLGSIQAIAERAGVHPNTLYNNLDGHNWQIEIVDKVANALDCKSTDLMVIEEVRE